MMNLQEAKSLYSGQTIYHATNRNADGTAQRWKVNGAVKTWVRDTSRVKVPLKYGLYNYDYLTEENLDELCLEDPTTFEYKVIDNEFNRANNANIIGKVFDSPPSYTMVERIKK